MRSRSFNVLAFAGFAVLFRCDVQAAAPSECAIRQAMRGARPASRQSPGLSVLRTRNGLRMFVQANGQAQLAERIR